MAINARKRAESSTPAIPMTLFFGKPLASNATWHMASRGLLTMIRIVFGDDLATCSVTFFMIPALVLIRSSRLMPGFRGIPAVIMTILDPSVASYALVPISRASCFSTGAASVRSSALPWGTPSTMSTKTTSHKSFSARRWAVVAPTLPAPTTVTFLSITLSFILLFLMKFVCRKG